MNRWARPVRAALLWGLVAGLLCACGGGGEDGTGPGATDPDTSQATSPTNWDGFAWDDADWS